MPAAHAEQAAAPATALYVLSAQAVHAADVSPAPSLLYVPAAHAVHPPGPADSP